MDKPEQIKIEGALVKGQSPKYKQTPQRSNLGNNHVKHLSRKLETLNFSVEVRVPEPQNRNGKTSTKLQCLKLKLRVVVLVDVESEVEQGVRFDLSVCIFMIEEHNTLQNTLLLEAGEFELNALTSCWL
jgi:hypothetical protein